MWASARPTWERWARADSIEMWVKRSMVSLFGKGMVGMLVRGMGQRRRRWRRRVDLPEPEGPVRRRIWPGDGGISAGGAVER
jgi:hypothetical protein